jgi:hypothetical protein
LCPKSTTVALKLIGAFELTRVFRSVPEKAMPPAPTPSEPAGGAGKSTRIGSVLSGGGLYTKGGGTVFELRDNKWVIAGTLTKADGTAGEKIRSLYEDKNDRLWAGSEYDGLAVFIGETAFLLDSKSGLANDEVKAITEDS